MLLRNFCCLAHTFFAGRVTGFLLALLVLTSSLDAQTFYREGFAVGAGGIVTPIESFDGVLPVVEFEYIGESSPPYPYAGLLFRLARGEVKDQLVQRYEGGGKYSEFMVPMTPFYMFSIDFNFRNWLDDPWEIGKGEPFLGYNAGISLLFGTKPVGVEDVKVVEEEVPEAIAISAGIGLGYDLPLNEYQTIRLMASLPFHLSLLGKRALITRETLTGKSSSDRIDAFVGISLGVSYQWWNYRFAK